MILATLHIKVLVSNILYVVSLLGQKGSKFDLRYVSTGLVDSVGIITQHTSIFCFYVGKLFFKAVSGAHCGGLLGSTLTKRR